MRGIGCGLTGKDLSRGGTSAWGELRFPHKKVPIINTSAYRDILGKARPKEGCGYYGSVDGITE